MNKDFWKTLYCWLDTASLADIDTKQPLVCELLGTAQDPDLQADMQRILRHMTEELSTRADLARSSALSLA